MSVILSPDEVQALAGGLTQPAAQLRELHRQGFMRARRSRVTGEVVVERAHYEAVCAEALGTRRGRRQPPEPQLLPA